MASRIAIITFLDGGPVDPGYGVPGFGGRPDQGLPTPPVYPGQGLPGSPNYPSQGLPGGGHIALLPVYPFDPTLSPDQGLPGPQPGPDQGLPMPGKKYVIKWLACQGLILVPDNSLPSGPPMVPGQELPETPEPKY